MKYTSYTKILNTTSPQELNNHPKRDHVLKMAHKEKWAFMSLDTSDKSSRVYAQKNKAWRESLIQSLSEVPREVYLQRLTEQERDALKYLIKDVLFVMSSDGAPPHMSLWNTSVTMLMAVGSTTYDDSYRETIERGTQQADRIFGGVQERLSKRGNDIDLRLCCTGEDNENYYYEPHHKERVERVVGKIKNCLEFRGIEYQYSMKEMKNGTDTGIYTDQNGENIVQDIQHEVYGSYPNFEIFLPGSRPIHLALSRESGDAIWKREYMVDRNYSVLCEWGLFGEPIGREEFVELIDALNEGKNIASIPQTLEEKLTYLDRRKRNNLIKKREQVARIQEMNTNEEYRAEYYKDKQHPFE